MNRIVEKSTAIGRWVLSTNMVEKKVFCTNTILSQRICKLQVYTAFALQFVALNTNDFGVANVWLCRQTQAIANKSLGAVNALVGNWVSFHRPPILGQYKFYYAKFMELHEVVRERVNG